MNVENFWSHYAEAAKTAFGFFWKAGWAFVLGYFVSAMIQAFVSKRRLTPYMGSLDFKSLSLSTLFGAISSSCSFAALATARSLFQKGAHFVAAVAFMFASTNLVIELGILILIFLGWQFLAAEVVGGLMLVAISSLLIHLTYPEKWVTAAKKKLDESSDFEDDFDWKKRIRSRMGWHLVGHKFVMEWKMVWEEILIGFTIAGFMAVFVPGSLWAKIFLINAAGTMPEWLRVLENALVAPFVAALTFIGSMGNIPLATVLNANGVLFAGIMGFIYSDLMVPPLVAVNAKYYGWRLALYIAGVMYISIVATTLILHYLFAFMGITPESARAVSDVAQFKMDYTFWLNLGFAAVTGGLIYLHRRHLKEHVKGGMDHQGGLTLKRVIVYLFIALLAGGLAAQVMVGGAG
ncbi:permease [Desulfuromonas soudanensis]|uniref:Permease n=1 Tax=Desulfuromonas soudanensis TaxID=1603606 RepID=A0A0M4CWG6_9BACT|nr:permease [Desulfuromonas soudanensis]ALC16328.1 permease [Desulfuromonas soudanensis]